MKTSKAIILFVLLTLIIMGSTASTFYQTAAPTATILPTSTANTPEPITPTPIGSTSSQETNNNIWELIVGGIIGITGTIIGSFVNHRLTIQRDRINRKEQEKEELRKKLTQGADEMTKKHNLARVPFHGGDSLYFPETARDETQSDLDKVSSELETLKESIKKIEQSVHDIRNQEQNKNE